MPTESIHDEEGKLESDVYPVESERDSEKQSPSDADPSPQPLEYPPTYKRILIMIALYLSMFLITLVSIRITNSILSYFSTKHRIKTSLQLQSLASPMNSTRSPTLGGMAVHTCSRLVASSYSWAKSTNTTQPSPSFSEVSSCLRSVQQSVVRLLALLPLLSAALCRDHSGKALQEVCSPLPPLLGRSSGAHSPIMSLGAGVSILISQSENWILLRKLSLGRFSSLIPSEISLFSLESSASSSPCNGAGRYTLGPTIWKKEQATLPPRIIKQRSIAAAMFFCFFNGAGMMVLMYYLPIWFQAIKGASAVSSGLMLLPTVLSVVVAAIFSGIVISRAGYYAPFYIASSILSPIGAGLMCTFTTSTRKGMWIGSQILFGFGTGLGVQQHLNVVQTVLERSDIAQGSAAVMLVRFLGSTIFIPIAQNVFIRDLASKLAALPGVDTETVIKGGATELRSLVPADELNQLLNYYNASLLKVFYIAAGTCAVTIFGSVCVEWRSLKAKARTEGGKPR
ncbi:major facilitator superfamily transporter [Cordyceps javanica]|nr:major facilitator superfamily transporter [Cordyceps javanica]